MSKVINTSRVSEGCMCNLSDQHKDLLYIYNVTDSVLDSGYKISKKHSAIG